MGDARTQTRARGPLVSAGFLLAALVVVGCGTGVSTSGPGGPGATPVDIADVSLNPASGDATPGAIATLAPAPSVAPPSGEPSARTVTVEYTFGADDRGAFLQAFRAAFPGIALDDDAIDRAGARVCTYLMRHADAAGLVSLDAALAEAEINEPGYAPEYWLAALEVANADYCRRFTIDP